MTSTATESMNVNGNTLDEVKLPKFLFSSLDYVKFVNKTNMNNPDKADDALISYLQGTQRGKRNLEGKVF
jgi:hypothetical protein